jgi:hypothetical protein
MNEVEYMIRQGPSMLWHRTNQERVEQILHDIDINPHSMAIYEGVAVAVIERAQESEMFDVGL